MLVNVFVEFLSANWGNIFSVVGAGLTVVYSRGAKKSADAAKTASNNAKARIVAIDWVLHFSEIVSQIDDLLLRLSQETDLQRVSLDLIKLKSKIAICLNQISPIKDEQVKRNILKSSTNISSISIQIDSYFYNPNNGINLPKIKKILSGQHELYSIALDIAKQNAMGSRNDN